jgi:hypothetical protein
VAVPTAVSISVRQLATKETLRESLDASRLPTLLLGQTADAPREFSCLDVRSGGSLVAQIGVHSAGIGVKPAFVLKEGRVVVGFNDRVAAIDLEPFRLVNEIDLLALFWTFIDLAECVHLCALCETAVVGVSLEGVLLWRVDTDLITDFAVTGTTASLYLADGPRIQVDLLAGRRLAIEGTA